MYVHKTGVATHVIRHMRSPKTFFDGRGRGNRDSDIRDKPEISIGCADQPSTTCCAGSVLAISCTWRERSGNPARKRRGLARMADRPEGQELLSIRPRLPL